MFWPWDALFGKNDDPLKNLDPTLRDFIEKERPRSYEPTQPGSSSEEISYTSKLGLIDPSAPKPPNAHAATENLPPEERPLPPESLYKDGRYAHLWKTYRPMAEVEDEGKSDQDKLRDILSGFRERQAEVGRAALENCAELQWEVHDCFRHGTWSARLTMCRAENRALNKCVGLQGRFLKALGYASVYERSDEEAERIQMHADRLYRRMLKQEEMIEEAKAKGEPVPEFPPLIRRDVPDIKSGDLARKQGIRAAAEDLSEPDTVVAPLPSKNTWEGMEESMKDKLMKEKFTGLEGANLELAKREIEQEIEDYEAIYWRLEKRYRDERRARKTREEAGAERLTDKIKRHLDFRPAPPVTDDDIPEDKRKGL